MPEQITTKSIYNIIADGYSIASKYFAEDRIVSYIFDGFKPSYRRMILSAYELCSKEYIKTITLIGYCLGRYHPHSSDSLASVATELVKAGILLGEGAFGGKYLDGSEDAAANPRYTEVMLNPEYTRIFDMILKYVPKVDGEMDNVSEYRYIPIPLPFVMNKGSFGLGPGLSVNTPAFTMESMLNAYRENNPELLKSTYGYDIINKNDNLASIWNNGRGSIYYQLKVSRTQLAGIDGAIIEGNAELVSLDLSVINEWRKKGLVRIEEIGNGNISKLFVGRNKGVTRVSNDMVYNELKRIATQRNIVLIRTIVNGVVRPIGLRTWIDSIFKNFIGLMEKYKEERVRNIESKMELISSIPVVRTYIFKNIDKNLDYAVIAKETGKKEEIIKEIDSWSLNRIRTINIDNEMKKLRKELENIRKFNCYDEAINFISRIDINKSTNSKIINEVGNDMSMESEYEKMDESTDFLDDENPTSELPS